MPIIEHNLKITQNYDTILVSIIHKSIIGKNNQSEFLIFITKKN